MCCAEIKSIVESAELVVLDHVSEKDECWIDVLITPCYGPYGGLPMQFKIECNQFPYNAPVITAINEVR